MRACRSICIALALAFLAGCSGERKTAPEAFPAGNEPPSDAAGSKKPGQAAGGPESFGIEPREPVRGTLLRLVSANPIPAGSKVEWMVNGRVESHGGVEFNTSGLRKGDTIEARLADGNQQARSQAVTLRNSPPEIRGIRLILGEEGQGSSIGVETETFDADGDPVQVDVQWRKNGAPAGTGNRLGAPAKRGDKIDVTVTPHDGAEPGRSATLHREIRNTPPVVEGQEQFKVDGSLVTFHVRASDADGDRLVFAVKDAPSGMKIDSVTGWVRWEMPSGTTGKVPFTVIVSDGAGGETTARFSVTIEAQPASAPR